MLVYYDLVWWNEVCKEYSLFMCGERRVSFCGAQDVHLLDALEDSTYFAGYMIPITSLYNADM